LEYSRLFYRNNGEVEEMNVTDILRFIIEQELKSKYRCERLEATIEDDSIKKQVRAICTDEEKHLKIVQQMYYQMTAQYVNISKHEDLSNESRKDLLKNCIEKELELVELYIRLQSMVPIPAIKGMLYEIITEEQNHSATLISIYSRQNRIEKSTALNRMPVTVTTKPVKAKDELIEIDLRIPVISGIPNRNIQRLINENIENDVMEFKRQMEAASKEGSEEAKAQGKPFIPYIASTNYAVTYDKNNILSISILYHEYVGGRNVFIRSSYNYDIKTGTSLGLRELFKPGVPYRELINTEVRRQIQASPDIYPPGAAQNFKGIAADQPYYLEGDNIVVYFGFNQLAPTISEIPVIRIPIAKFKNQLRPEYFA
jgi:rubrerythrin